LEKFTKEETRKFAESLITEKQLEILKQTKNLDFSFSY